MNEDAARESAWRVYTNALRTRSPRDAFALAWPLAVAHGRAAALTRIAELETQIAEMEDDRQQAAWERDEADRG